jgi:hypothetical protein
MICLTSSVRSAGAQKSESGIKLTPVLNLQLPTQVASSKDAHSVNSFSALAKSSSTGWQKALVKSGVGPVGAGSTGVVGVVGFFSSIGFHSQRLARLAHPALSLRFWQSSFYG